jgi:hypothetical protein
MLKKSLFVAAASLVSLVVGCGGSTTQDPVSGSGGGGGGPYPEYVSLCTGSPVRAFPLGLTAEPAIDGAVERSETAFAGKGQGYQGGGVTPPPAGASGDLWKGGAAGTPIGTLCATATDKAACLAKVSGYRILPVDEQECRSAYPAGYSQNGCSASYLLYTRGDDIGVARTPAETKTLMGTIDTPEEASYLLNNAGYFAACGYNGVPDSMFRTTADGGYDFKMIKQESCVPTAESAVLHVDYAGTITVVSTETVTTPTACAGTASRPVHM